MASLLLDDHPSSPLTASTSRTYSPKSGASIEAFPDFPSSPVVRSSPLTHNRTPSNSHLEVPGQQPQQSQPPRPARPFRSASQRLPPTALLPASRNASRNDVSTPTNEEPPQQRLPRAKPAPSLAGPSVRPTASIAPGLLRNSSINTGRHQPNAEELKSESLWADMQRTLADVELSAMKSSHLFNAPHSQALERLRETQLALAQAWARSEAEEVAGQESEDESFASDGESEMKAGTLALRTASVEQPGLAKGGPKGKPGAKDLGGKGVGGDARDRKDSTGSNIGRDLEEETERDIRRARKRREANDHYFSQVNHGVLDVVSRLDEVASAMKIVERESRAVWNEMGQNGGGSTVASATELDGDTDGDDQRTTGLGLSRKLTQATSTTGTGFGTESGTELSDSPVTPKKSLRKDAIMNDKTKEMKRMDKEKGR